MPAKVSLKGFFSWFTGSLYAGVWGVCVCKEKWGRRGREKERSLVSLIIRTLIPSCQKPTLMTSFNLNYLLKGPISKYSHTGLPHMSSVDIKFSPKHDTINSLSSFFSEGIGLDFQSI